MDSTKASEEVMQATQADPYAGITLPEPPTGYRLAKWGEEWAHRDALWLDGKKWVTWEFRSQEVWWDKDGPTFCIFALPLDQPSPPKSWQFREVPWVPKQPETLADVPEGVDVIVGFGSSICHVMFRDGEKAFYRKCDGTSGQCISVPAAWRVVRYLDPPTQKPLSLGDVPDGRVIRCRDRWHWKVGPTWWRLSNSGGVWPNLPPNRESEFTITDYIAEFRGPA